MNIEYLEDRIDQIHRDLISLEIKFDQYDITKQYFEIGDKVWTYGDKEPESGTVVEIQDFRNTIGDNACVYYWVQMDSITIFDKIVEPIKFYSWLYFLRILGFWQPKINPKLGPGHALDAGKEVFSTKLEALVSMRLAGAISELDELSDKLKNNESIS